MDEFDEPIDYLPVNFVCWDCDNPLCINGMCDPLNWSDDEVIDEFIIQLYWDIPDDEELSLQHIFDWYW